MTRVRRIATCVGHLFEKTLERQLINQLSQHVGRDPETRHLAPL